MSGINRVAVMREAITKITQILSDKGIRVTQQGIQAFVMPDEKGKPVRVNLPYIPDEAPEELIAAIQGFLDHEVAHVMFSDFSVLGDANKGNYKFFLNALEDTRIERNMAEKFRGSAHNLSTTLNFFLEQYIEPKFQNAIAKGDTVEAAQILFVPLIRAMSGQLAAKEYLADKEHLVKPIRDLIGDLESKIQNLDSTADAVAVAKEIKKRLGKKESPAPSGKPEKPEPKKSASSEKPEPESEDTDPADEDETDEESESDGKAEKSDKPEENTEEGEGDAEPEDSDEESSDDEDEADDDKAENDEEDKGDDDEESDSGLDDDSDDSDDGDSDEADGDDSEDKSDDDSEGESDGDSSDEESDADGEDDLGEADESSSTEAPEDSEDAVFEKNPLIMEALDKESGSEDTYDDSLSQVITKDVVLALKDEDYIVYTNDYDVIEPLHVGAGFKSEMLKSLQESVDHMVGSIQKDLERAISARSMARWQGGMRKGRLNPANLAKAAIGDDRVFRQREEAMSKDVAVELVVDMSGSMRMSGKIGLAARAAYALASTLDRIGIKCEVICFTTKDMPRNVINEMSSAERHLGSGQHFSRYDALYMPVVKGFNERMSTDVKNRFGWLPNIDDMRSNIDGESIRIAANRLLMRKERGKIMMVLSDGMPAGNSYADLNSHLVKTVEEITKQGVKTVGIGIMTDAVRKFYPKSVVLNNVNDLPGTVIRELRQLLL